MSLIFDALQRWEAEHAGVDPSALSAATEVLRRAELRAIIEGKPLIPVETLGVEPGVDRAASLPRPATVSAAAVVDPPDPGEPLLPGERVLNGQQLDTLNQMQSLKVVAPAHNRLVCFTDSGSLAAEKFRFLGISLQNLRREQSLKKVLITSTIPQEGKSTVSANLACTLARRTQQRTLLLEGDVRRPTQSQLFGGGMHPGLCECLQGDRDLANSVYYLEGPGFWLLPAGSAPNHPLELLQSGRLAAMMDQLATWFDWIIIDSPPVMPLADTSVWMRQADGILLVLRQGTTEKGMLQSGLEAIERKKLIGALLNETKKAARNDYYYDKLPALASDQTSRVE
jgi:capsular exopolysaccharide synthesis family protein